ncbi:hypothetical protein Q3G72_003989 [Acer saccharum]|nr:hypothetical protein Q3G72_003989 [Acer saccharum]
MMASSSNNQGESLNSMDLEHYSSGSEIMPDSGSGQRMIFSENDSNIGEGRHKGNTVRSKSIEDGKVEAEGTFAVLYSDKNLANSACVVPVVMFSQGHARMSWAPGQEDQV